MPKVISIVGQSNSGKTTLLEALIPEMTVRGYRVGSIKHNVHGFEIDHEGKDSWRHKRAGSRAVAIVSASRIALIKDIDKALNIDEIINAYMPDLDIVFTEGYKKGNKPKIELLRKEDTANPMCKSDETVIALVTDAILNVRVPCFRPDQTGQLADFLERYLLDGQS